jgi:hypothetical protein
MLWQPLEGLIVVDKKGTPPLPAGRSSSGVKTLFHELHLLRVAT